MIPEMSRCDAPFILTASSLKSMIAHHFIEAHGGTNHDLDEGRARMSLALALWILVVPAADWSWTILDGPFESAVTCEARRGARLDADYTLCAKLPMMRHHEYSPPSGRVSSFSPCISRREKAAGHHSLDHRLPARC
jgi:hypothetical protein